MIARTSAFSCSWFRLPTVVATLASGALLAAAVPAHANEVSPDGKGITGGALLGGEVVMLGEAAFGVKSGLAYVIGGVVGAGGGGVAGYFAEKNANPKVSLYMLAGGLALVIPTTVAVLQASSYHIPEDYTEDHPPAGVPAAEPPRPSGPPLVPTAPPTEPAVPPPAPPTTAPAPSGPSSSLSPEAVPAPAPSFTMLHLRYHWSRGSLATPKLGLVDLSESGLLSFSVPAIEIRPVYSPEEMQAYGLSQHQELRVPILAGTF